MVIQVNRWTPDTCNGCIIEFDTDTDTGSSSNFRRIQTCDAHSVLTTGTEEEKVQHIRNENARGHGNVLAQLLQNAPTALFDTQTDGSRTFKQGVTVTWSWSGIAPNRVLNITVTGVTLTANQQNNIRNAVDTRFGSGNVIITFG